MDRKTYTLDASNKSLGRVASKASILLQGKNIPSYEHAKDEGGFVNIINAKELKFTGKKFKQKNITGTLDILAESKNQR